MKITRARLKPFGGSTLYESVKGKIKSLIEKNKGDIFQFVVDDSGVKSVKEFGPDNINPELVEKSVRILDGPFEAMFNSDGSISVVVPENESISIIKKFDLFKINRTIK